MSRQLTLDGLSESLAESASAEPRLTRRQRIRTQRLAALTAVMTAEIDCAEMRDSREREHGGHWRESESLLPGEQVIRDERLT